MTLQERAQSRDKAMLKTLEQLTYYDRSDLIGILKEASRQRMSYLDARSAERILAQYESHLAETAKPREG